MTLIRLTPAFALLLSLLLYGRLLVDDAQANLAWVLIVKSFHSDHGRAALLQRAGALFDYLAERDTTGQREAAWAGRLVQAELGNYPRISADGDPLRRVPAAPDKLLALSDWYAGQNAPERSLTLLRTMTDVLGPTPDANHRISTICRRHFLHLDELTAPTQKSCSDYWAQHSNNLASDGQFDVKSFVYWERHSTPGSDYRLDATDGRPAPSAQIVTDSAQYHGGLFQELYLPPGTIVTFQARMKIAGEGDLRVLPLYVAYTVDSQEVVGAGAPMTESRDWQTLRRTVTIGEADDMRLLFYPAYIFGSGSVWVDDIQIVVETLSTADMDK